MLQPITKRQIDIILFLYRFRFLNRIQIQKLLNHKNPKNINTWLKDLSEKKYIERIFEKIPGINKPAIYYLTANGIKFLKSLEGVEIEYLKKLRQEKRKSKAFIDQSIEIGNIYLNLNSQNLAGFKFYTQNDFPINGIIRELSPTFAYVIDDQNTIKQYSCEVIKPNMPRFAIRARIAKYLEFFSSEINVNIIFICPNDLIKKYLIKFIQKQLIEENIDNLVIYVVTIDKISRSGIEQSILEEIEH